jgi:kynurenine formamidase
VKEQREGAGVNDADDDYLAWIRWLGANRRFGEGDRIGTANLIDGPARRRAVEAIRSRVTVSLARAVAVVLGLDRFAIDLHARSFRGLMDLNADRVELECHGTYNTHMDALNHVGLDGTWYGGFPVTGDGPSIADLAGAGLVTRGVHVDIAATRGVEWVSFDEPVTGDDIDRALDRAGVVFQPGDALLVDMGRDRFTAAGNDPNRPPAESGRGGLGASAARWIVEHEVAILGWDFADSAHASEPPLPIHLLNWAVGLVLIDNCEFSALRATAESGLGVGVGTLVAAPPPIERGTGALVNPLLVL